MRNLEGRIKERLKQLGVPFKPTYPDGLTEREVEVLRHIVLGLTNQKIGDKLFISPKTVQTHIRNIYEKIGAANRAEASAYAIRKGLTEE
jgi:DNA-binding CsgD family transcriptional regulator